MYFLRVTIQINNNVGVVLQKYVVNGVEACFS